MTIQLQLVSNMLLHLVCVLQCSYTLQGIGMMYLIMCLLHAMAAKSRLSHVTAVCTRHQVMAFELRDRAHWLYPFAAGRR